VTFLQLLDMLLVPCLATLAVRLGLFFVLTVTKLTSKVRNVQTFLRIVIYITVRLLYEYMHTRLCRLIVVSDPARFPIPSLSFQYYSTEVHRASFALPGTVQYIMCLSQQWKFVCIASPVLCCQHSVHLRICVHD
jgi:hypothetical protein